MTTGKPPRGVHLVGSVPLGSAEEVFRTAGSILGRRLRRIPDGETGNRLNWIEWQLPRLAQKGQFETVPPRPGAYPERARLRLRPGVSAGDLRFDRPGYAEAARASYSVFSRLRSAGLIPERCRFQVSLPTPLAPVNALVMSESQAVVEGPYETGLLAELDEITAAIPREALAIQWDVAVEMAVLEGMRQAHFGDVEAGIIERLVRIGDRVPEGVELGYHFCYGDYRHRHFKEPENTAKMVEMANAVSAALGRPISWIHMPVPRDRSDLPYFAPLRDLSLRGSPEIYLGLVHFTDGVPGARRRIETAGQIVDKFGVATECGLGRRDPSTIPALLQIHAEVADPVS